MLSLLNWNIEYIDLDVLDGAQWEVEIVREKRNLTRSGRNQFPAQWEAFCTTMRKLTGQEFQ